MKHYTVWYVFDHDEGDYVVIDADTEVEARTIFNTQLNYGMIDEVYESTPSELALKNR